MSTRASLSIGASIAATAAAPPATDALLLAVWQRLESDPAFAGELTRLLRWQGFFASQPPSPQPQPTGN